jgi:hypothetical protein
MFWAAHRSSTGALNCICSLWFLYPLPRQRPVTTWVYKPEAANTVWSFWWWAVCRSKHVKPSLNFGIMNSIRKLHLVGISAETVYYISVNCSTCFGWLLHPLPGTHIIVITASGTGQTVSATFRYRGEVGDGLSSARCCNYNYMCSWWWVE